MDMRQASAARRVAESRAIAALTASGAPTASVPKDAGLLNALTIIAHDLRGPLANLQVLMELIDTYVELQAHDRVRRSTRKAQELIEVLSGMLHGFLQRAKETGDPLAFRPSLVDLADVVAAAVDLNRPIAESRNVGIECTAVRPFAVTGDRRLLLEAVDNLVGNAVKHTPPGSTVTCEIVARGRDAIVCISDEGQGLSELDLKRAFRPFATLSAKYRGKGTSWGLGLWIVRLITERHGGHVEVHGRGRGPGASFELHLPAVG